MLQKDKPAYDQVVDYCRQVTAISPDNIKALYRMGVALFHSNKPEEALRVFEEAYSLPEGRNGPLGECTTLVIILCNYSTTYLARISL